LWRSAARSHIHAHRARLWPASPSSSTCSRGQGSYSHTGRSRVHDRLSFAPRARRGMALQGPRAPGPAWLKPQPNRRPKPKQDPKTTRLPTPGNGPRAAEPAGGGGGVYVDGLAGTPPRAPPKAPAP
jgi:hypothetical protein